MHDLNVMLSSKTHTDRGVTCASIKVIDYGWLMPVADDVAHIKALQSLAWRLDWHFKELVKIFGPTVPIGHHLGVSKVITAVFARALSPRARLVRQMYARMDCGGGPHCQHLLEVASQVAFPRKP